MSLIDEIVDTMVGAGKKARCDVRVLGVENDRVVAVYLRDGEPVAVVEVMVMVRDELFEESRGVVLLKARIMEKGEAYGSVVDKLYLKDAEKTLEKIGNRIYRLLRSSIPYILSRAIESYGSEVSFKYGRVYAWGDEALNIHLELRDVAWEQLMENTKFIEEVTKIAGVGSIINCLMNGNEIKLILQRKQVIRRPGEHVFKYESKIGSEKVYMMVKIRHNSLDMTIIHRELSNAISEWLDEIFRNKNTVAELFKLCAGGGKK